MLSPLWPAIFPLSVGLASTLKSIAAFLSDFLEQQRGSAAFDFFLRPMMKARNSPAALLKPCFLISRENS
jgi:hypothetical protein